MGPQKGARHIKKGPGIDHEASFSQWLNNACPLLVLQLTFRDRENIHSLYEQSADTDFRLRDILLAIVSSDGFTKR